MSEWSLFLDDERNPEDVSWVKYDQDYDWTICRTWAEVKHEIISHGQQPTVSSFDHDLGMGELNGREILDNMIQLSLDGHYPLRNMTLFVHSMNPVGARNIHSLWYSYVGHMKDF
jgi:hypothetical protein